MPRRHVRKTPGGSQRYALAIPAAGQLTVLGAVFLALTTVTLLVGPLWSQLFFGALTAGFLLTAFVGRRAPYVEVGAAGLVVVGVGRTLKLPYSEIAVIEFPLPDFGDVVHLAHSFSTNIIGESPSYERQVRLRLNRRVLALTWRPLPFAWPTNALLLPVAEPEAFVAHARAMARASGHAVRWTAPLSDLAAVYRSESSMPSVAPRSMKGASEAGRPPSPPPLPRERS